MVGRLPFVLSDGIERRGVGAAQSRRWLGLALQHFEYGLAVERQADAQLAPVFVKRIFALASKDRAALDDRLGVVERHALHGDHSTLKADVPSAVLKNTNYKR